MTESLSTGSSPRRIRLANASAALQHLHSSGRMSRADLARRLGLNRSSSGQIVAEMVQSGLIREVEETPATDRPSRGAGRPGIMVELVPDAGFFVGIEIGVEHISAVIIDLAGKVRHRAEQAISAIGVSAETSVERAVSLAFAGVDPQILDRCRGIGVSAPVHIRPDGIVNIAPMIGWRELDLAAVVAKLLPIPMPILIENDANALAFGDAYGNQRAGVTLFIQLETGVGGGIMIDGKLFRGGNGLSGEVGHMVVPETGGRNLQDLIGREPLVQKYRVGSGKAEAKLHDFIRAVQEREPAAISIAEEWSHHLGYVLAQACRVIDPNRIVLGGAVGALYPMVSARVWSYFTQGWASYFPQPEIVVDDQPEYGSAFGAACLMHQKYVSADSDVLSIDDATPAATMVGE